MKKKAFAITLYMLLIALAAVLGYKGARFIADSITVKAEQNAEKAGLFRVKDPDEDKSPADSGNDKKGVKYRSLNLIYIVDYETGKIDKLVTELIDTVGMTVSYIYIDPDISYTMSRELYKKLITGNVLISQTVTLKELYAYYGTDSAFAAGKKIVGELMGTPMDYYTVYSKESVPGELLAGSVTSAGLKELHEGSVVQLSDMEEETGMELSKVCAYIDDGDIEEFAVPVIRRNESCFADANGIIEILTKLLIY